MPSEPIPNGSPEDLEALKQENAALKEQLKESANQADEFRKAAYEMLDEVFPCTMPTAEEIEEILHGPRGRSPFEMLEEFEREQVRGQG
jgi:hypothetical protein